MMNSSNRDLSPELNALVKEADALSTVLHALEAEHEALLEGDSGKLEDAVARKQMALAEHAATAQERESLGLAQNITQSIKENRNLTDSERAQGLALASQLRSAGADAKQKNQRNGMLIAGLRERTSAALGILRPGESGITLYGQQGQANQDLGSRILGRA